MHKNRICVEDTIAYKYAYQIANRKVVAGKYIIMECQRFLDDIHEMRTNPEFEWTFDMGIYNFIMSFQSLFKFADGIKAGMPLQMADFQIWIISCLFCWKHKTEGYVRYSKAYIQVSRKQGKSFLLGFIVIIKSLLEKYGQFFVCATKKDQASIVVKEVKKLLDMSEKCVKDRFTIYGKASISKIVSETTLSEIAPLSADANTLDGLGVDLAVIDEFGAHPNYSIYEVMRSSQIYKLNSQIVIITTAYPNTATSPAYTERCILIDNYEGKIPRDYRYFSAIYEMDEGDSYEEKENWGKSNPLFVQFPEIMKKLESDFNSAKNDPEKLQLFRTKNLNEWLNGDATIAYLDFDEWKKNEVEEVSFEGEEVYVGVDLSKSVDLSAVSILSKDIFGNVKLKSKAFLPKDTINHKEITDKLPYSAYAVSNPEWLTVTEGKFVNQIEIEKYIRSIEETYKCKIKAICFDSYQALHLMSSLSEDYDVIDIKMTYKNFSPIIKRFREEVYGGYLHYEKNPILNFCVANAITKSDTQENILLDKKRSTNRIDLLVSAIIAYAEVVDEEVNDDYGDYFMI